MMSSRSYLYVPGNRAERLATADTRGADAIIADLEDSVPVADKAVAREAVGRWLTGRGSTARHQVWVRVNAHLVEEEVPAVLSPALTGIIVPKAESGLLERIDAFLTEVEASAGLTVGQTAMIALIETARGLLDVAALAEHPRVVRLGIGEVDLIAELRLRPGEAREELTAIRLQVVVASAAAKLDAPVGPTSTDFRDLALFRRSTEALMRLGFRSRTAIHPAQVPIINEVFTPSEREVADARRLVEQFERSGSGVTLDDHGRMVDEAVVRSARETLARAAWSRPLDEGSAAQS